GFTALHAAVRNNNAEVAALLLQFGADPNLIANPQLQNASPLLWSVRSGCFECAELLIDYGADVTLAGGVESKTTPLSLATRKGFRDIAKVLIENGARP